MAELPNVQAPLLVLPDDASLLQLLVSAALASYFGTETKFSILSKNPAHAVQLRKFVENVSVRSDLPSSQYILTLKSPDVQVKSVRWEQQAGKVQIYLDLQAGTLVENQLQLTLPEKTTDLIVLLGNTTVNGLDPDLSENNDLFQNVAIFGIGSELNLGDDYQYTTSNLERLSTLGEQALETLNEQKLTANVAQLLMAAIFLETDYLKTGVKTSEIFLSLKKLADAGAQTADCAEIITSLTSIDNAQRG